MGKRRLAGIEGVRVAAEAPRPAAKLRPGTAIRVVATWLIPALVLLAVSASAIDLSSEEEDDAVERFFPLDLGTTWVYETTNKGIATDRKTMQVVDKPILAVSEFGKGIPKGSATVPGTTLLTKYENFLGRGPFERSEYVLRVRDGLYVLGDHPSRDRLKIADPIQPVFKAPLTEGQSFSYEGSYGQEIDARTQVVEVGTIEVAGREFNGCAHLHTDSKLTGGDGVVHEATIEEWLCPGVGRVRSEEKAPTLDVDYTEELVEFHSGARDFGSPSAPASLIDEEGTPGASSGINPGRSNFVPDADLVSEYLSWSQVHGQNSNWPVVGGDGFAVFAEEDGLVTALDTETGDIRWRVGLQGPIVAPPTVADSVVLVGDAAKNLHALDVSTGAARWSAGFSDVLEAAPLAADDKVVAVLQDRTIRALDLATGDEVWDARAGGRIVGAPARAGDAVVVTDDFGGVTAYELGTGDQAWQFEPDDAASTAAVVQDGLVVATDDGGVISGLRASDGEVLWDYVLRGYSIASIPPAVDGRHVVLVSEVATGDNVVTALDARDGDRLWETTVAGDLSYPAIILGDEAIVVGDEAEIFEIDLVAGEIVDRKRFPSIDGTTPASTAQPPGFADGALIVSIYTNPPWGEVTHFALLSTGTLPENEGVYFRNDFRQIPSTPVTKPLLDGNDVVFGDFDGVVWSVPPEGTPSPVFKGAPQPSFAVPAGELLLAQEQQDLVGVEPGGNVRWRLPIGETGLGTYPVVSGGTTFVPLRGAGIFAVDLAEGKPLWTASSPGRGLGSPLASPDGDVFYGTGGIARYDGRDGEREWIVEGVESLNEMVVADGDLFLIGFDFNRDEVALMRIDGVTGKELWRHPWNAPFLVGLAATSDVVVVSDDRGKIGGFDAATGEQLWALASRTPLGATPIIAGNHVVMVEGGRFEHLGGRDYRVRVHDLRTGRFLGAFDLFGALFLPGTIGSTEEGTVLAPATLALQVLVELETREW